MNRSENGKPVEYKIDMSGVIVEKIKALKKEQDQRIERALRMIMKRLQNDPLNFGELVGQYKTLSLIIHVAVVSPLFVRFAIHQKDKFVVIANIDFV